MAFRLLGIRRLAGLAKKISLPLSEHWRQVCTSNSTHFGGCKDLYGISRCLCISGYAALVLVGGIQYAVAEEASENETNGGMNGSREASMSEGSLRILDYGEVMTNAHTTKWRAYTNQGQKLFSEGKLDEAENYFLLALEEAKQGFGLLDPHVASSSNNLRALKIKRRILGLNHPDYANTMFHLGEVLRLQGNLADAKVLIRDSIRILEEGKLGQSHITIKRMGHLARILLETDQLQEAENLQRKILHILEVSQGWDSLNTAAAAEQLALTIQALGNLDEAQELLERCLDAKRKFLPENHVQVGATMLELARITMLKASRNKRVNPIEAELELEKARELLNEAIRIADLATQLSIDATGDDGAIHKRPTKEEKDAQAALLTLLQSIDALGQLEISMLELHQVLQKKYEDITEAEEAVRKCVSAVKKPGIPEQIVKSEPIRREYLSCLQHLISLLSRTSVKKNKQVKEEIRQLNKEIAQIQAELGIKRARWFF